MTLPTVMQEYIARSRYARYLPELKRRETWEETVQRYVENCVSKAPLPTSDVSNIKKSILSLEIMPSMRCLMTAGKALDRDNVAGYNCAYVAVDNPKVFDEILYILMCGTGVGFSVELEAISKLPEVAEEFHDCDTIIRVADSKIGWASAFRQLLALLYSGQVPKWDLSKLRPAGAILKTFGGRSSGPTPLSDLFTYSVMVFKGAAGRKLNSIEVHDLVCKTAEVVVCGGVRRSALLSLSDLTDERMRHAKDGQFWISNQHRSLANNSTCYTEKPDLGVFLREWTALYESKAGERGIFARYACDKKIPTRRQSITDPDELFGTNPCSEIILRSRQFCNLTEVVIRKEDTLDNLKRKIRLATILGTIQSTLTDFRYLSAGWKKNTEEERLLGVSLTGIMDHEVMSGSKGEETLITWLKELKMEAIKTNEDYAKRLGIPQSTAITCVKPSGTVSQLVDSASGIHQRHSQYYIRRIRADKKDPLCQALYNAGVPNEPDINNPGAVVFSFPVLSPHSTYTTNALSQLRLWKLYDDHYCEHKPSCTINVGEGEWLEVAAWVYKEFDTLSGISFFPKDNHVYKQAPYEAITEEVYNEMVSKFPTKVDFNVNEEEDGTTASQELACTGGQCDII